MATKTPKTIQSTTPSTPASVMPQSTNPTIAVPAALTAASPTPPSPPPITGVSSGSTAGTKVDIQTSYLALIAGLLAYYQPGDPFVLSTGTMTRDQVIAQFQHFVATMETTKANYQAWRASVEVEAGEAPQAASLRADVKSIVQGRFKKSSPTMLTFGFPPAKVAVKSTAAKTAAVAKAEATRAARGTKGSVQKKAVKGNVTGVVITPVTAGPSVPHG